MMTIMMHTTTAAVTPPPIAAYEAVCKTVIQNSLPFINQEITEEQ